MTRALAFFLLIIFTLNFKSCENNLKLLRSEIAEINKEVDQEEAKAREDEGDTDSGKYVLPRGMTEYTLASLNLNFAFPAKWKLVIFSEKRKNVDIEFQIPGSKVRAYLKAEANPGIADITQWQGGRYTHIITKLSEFEGKQDNAQLIRLEGTAPPDVDVMVALFFKYNIIAEFSLAGSEPELSKYRSAFEELVKSVRFKRRYDVDI